MSNYEAIQSMSPEQMEDILDQIYLAGLNNGMYAAIRTITAFWTRIPLTCTG